MRCYSIIIRIERVHLEILITFIAFGTIATIIGLECTVIVRLKDLPKIVCIKILFVLIDFRLF